MITKELIDALANTLGITEGSLAGILGVSTAKMISWTAVDDPKSERLRFLFDIVTFLVTAHGVKEKDLKNIIHNARVKVNDPDPGDDRYDGTVALAGYITGWYGDPRWEARVEGALDDYKLWIAGGDSK